MKKHIGLRFRSRRVPFVPQTTMADCGASCLTMALRYFGKDASLAEVRQSSATGSYGVNAQDLCVAARQFGLRARGVRVTSDELDCLPPGSILHWDFNHFVVLEQVRNGWIGPGKVEVVDPGHGRLQYGRSEFLQSFTGVAIILEPGEGFEPEVARDSAEAKYVREVLGQSNFLVRIALLSVIVQVVALSVPLLTGLLVDRIVPERQFDMLGVISVLMACAVLFHAASYFMRGQLLVYMRTHLDSQMTLRFLEHMVELPYTFFETRAAGDLGLRVTSNRTVRELLTSSAMSGFFDGTLVIGYLVLMLILAPRMGLLVGLLAVLHVAIYLLGRRKSRELAVASLRTKAQSQDYLMQMLSGFETLKSSGTETDSLVIWSDLHVDELNASVNRGRLEVTLESLLAALRLASPLAVLIYGGYLTIRGEVTLGRMLAVSAMAGGFLVPLSGLISTALKYQLLGSYLERINDVLESPKESELARGRLKIPLQGSIEFEGLSFRYSRSLPYVLKEVSFRIEPGQFAVVVGPSGAGKSTLARLLLGLYQPSEGRILVDDTPLTALELRSYRRQVGIVPQRYFVFGQTIQDNISMGDPSIPMSQIIEAAKAAQIHDDIVQLPMGYDATIAAGGLTLSGGQGQRLALARALVRKPRLLLLDEATSAVDGITEAAIHANLASLECTRLMIAHRSSTIRWADTILVLDGGMLREQGTHQELLKSQGLYSRLMGEPARGGWAPLGRAVRDQD